MAVTLCLQQAANSHANSTGMGGLALALCLGLHLTEGKMAGEPTLSHAHTTSLALSPQWCRAKAPPAQQGGHRITINSPGFWGMAPGRDLSGGDQGRAHHHGGGHEASEEDPLSWTITLLECCFWNDIVWSFRHHACRCLTHDLDLLYYDLILPVCKVTSILATMITGIQLLARCMKSYQSQRESKKQWPESLPSMVWGYSECAICLQGYKPGETLKLLSCSHAFHGKGKLKALCMEQTKREEEKKFKQVGSNIP
ncbi:hypothetical protein llap_17818 [Limosa lapponica baueri]|uniref:RING-type domain-containing protein n=1 Tax=Limosa lapponica baueri TaxID=1758121 RepID=A0A2I0TDJ3_LIMLA|nr:hypothetical protein llap_17818 [Limosa lapponica baueri]